jgi:putative membrane protein
MTTSLTTRDPPTANDMAEERTSLALKRTLMAADRSLMAWTRTGLSLISFGFTIYKVLQAVEEQTHLASRLHSPRNVGLYLLALGTLSIWLGGMDYWQTLKELNVPSERRFGRAASILAIIMSLTGLVLFVGLIGRLL